MPIRLFDDTAKKSDLIRLFDPDDVPQLPPAPVSEPSFFERNFPGTKEAISDIKKDPLNLAGIREGDFLGLDFERAKQTRAAAVRGLLDPIKALGGNIADLWKSAAPGETKAKRFAAGTETIAGIGEVIFSPVTTLFELANQVPVLGTTSKALGVVFSAFGEVGSGAVSRIIDVIPENVMPQDVKEEIKPGLEEIGALAAQLALGKLGHSAFNRKKASLIKKHGKEDAQTIVTEATRVAERESAATTEPKKTRLFEEEPPPARVRPEERLGAREERTELGAVETKLTEGLRDIPDFEAVNKKRQAKLAVDLLDRNPKLAKEVAMGRVEPPLGLRDISVYVAVEERAIRTSDITTQRELAINSRLTQVSSIAGQTLSLLAERTSESPVSAMTEIIKERTKRVKDPEKAKSTIKKDIKKEIKAPTKETWNSFIDSLIC